MTWLASTAADRLEQLTRARVRRLPAADDRRHPEVAEDRGQAVPGCDGDDAEGRCRDGRRRGGRLTGNGAGGVPAVVVPPLVRDGARRRTSSPHALPNRPSRRSDPARECRRLRLADVAGLVVEVLDADPAEGALAQPVADDEVRPLVVDVDLERPAVARHEHRLADRLEVVADGVDVEAAGAVRLEQEHRLVAEALVGVRDERRWLCSGAGVGTPPGGARRRLPDQVEQRALEEPVQALARRSRRHRPRAGSRAGSASGRPTSRRRRAWPRARSRCRCRVRPR